ncbi:uncharacterized protein Gasu_64940, partial [Galdieria sulphuraria]
MSFTRASFSFLKLTLARQIVNFPMTLLCCYSTEVRVDESVTVDYQVYSKSSNLFNDTTTGISSALVSTAGVDNGSSVFYDYVTFQSKSTPTFTPSSSNTPSWEVGNSLKFPTIGAVSSETVSSSSAPNYYSTGHPIPFSYSCPEGSFLTKFGYSAVQNFDTLYNIGPFSCSDGTVLNDHVGQYSTIDYYETKTGWKSGAVSNGYDRCNCETCLVSISLYENSSGYQTCGNNLITGVYGVIDGPCNYVNSLGFYCSVPPTISYATFNSKSFTLPIVIQVSWRLNQSSDKYPNGLVISLLTSSSSTVSYSNGAATEGVSLLITSGSFTFYQNGSVIGSTTDNAPKIGTGSEVYSFSQFYVSEKTLQGASITSDSFLNGASQSSLNPTFSKLSLPTNLASNLTATTAIAAYSSNQCDTKAYFVRVISGLSQLTLL